MAVIITSLPAIFLTGNKSELIVQENPGTNESNTIARYLLKFVFPFTFDGYYSEANGIFDLHWVHSTQRMYLRENPNSSGNQLHYDTAFETPLEYVTDACNRLKNNAAIAAYFNLRVTTIANIPYIAFEAIRPGSLNLARMSVYGFTSQPELTGTDGQTKTIYNKRTARVTVLYENDLPATLEKFYTEQNNLLRATFNMGDAIKAENTEHYTYPVTDALMVKQPKAATSFKIQVKQSLNGIYTSVGVGFYGPFLAINGKLPDMRAAMLEADGQTPIQWLGPLNQRKFLTFMPNPKITDIYAPEKLYYLVPANGDYSVTVKKEFLCIDKIETSEPMALKENDIVEINAGYASIAANEMYQIYAYEIYIKKSGTTGAYSEVFRFEVDRTYRAYARYFLFKNSWGMYECLRTTGKIERESIITKTLIEINGSARTQRARSHIQTNANSLVSYNINTGHNNAAHDAWIEEIALSPQVMLIRGANVYPVVVQPSKLASAEGEFIHNQNLTISHLRHTDFTPEFASDTPILPDFNNDFNKDFNSFSYQNSGDYLPLANAGNDATAQGNTPLQLAANNPPEGQTGTWSKFSGPGTAQFSNPNAHNSTVTFSANGTYILRWTVAYGRCTEFSDIVVVVENQYLDGFTLIGFNEQVFLQNFNVYNPINANYEYCNEGDARPSGKNYIYFNHYPNSIGISIDAEEDKLPFGYSTKQIFNPGTYEITLLGNYFSYSQVVVKLGENEVNMVYDTNISVIPYINRYKGTIEINEPSELIIIYDNAVGGITQLHLYSIKFTQL